MTINEIKTNVETYLISIKGDEFNEFHIRNHIYRTFIKPYENELFIKRALTIIQQHTSTTFYCSIIFYFHQAEDPAKIEINV